MANPRGVRLFCVDGFPPPVHRRFRSRALPLRCALRGGQCAGQPARLFTDHQPDLIPGAGAPRCVFSGVPPVGRGSRLNRAARAKAWRVFEEYRTQLAERGLKEVDDAYRDAAVLLQNDRDELGYAAVIVDEAQDMGAQAYRLIRNIVPADADDLFVVGDGHQRIYGPNRVGRCGIDVRGRSRSCACITAPPRRPAGGPPACWPAAPSMISDGGSDDDQGITSLTRGPEPLLKHFDSREDQSAFIVAYLKQIQAEESSLRGVCVVARTRRERDAIGGALKKQDLAHVALEADTVDPAETEGVRLATMYRVKGLEFDRVVRASMNADLVPPAAIDARGDTVERESAKTEERALVYVAATRAKKELLVLSFDTPSRLL